MDPNANRAERTDRTRDGALRIAVFTAVYAPIASGVALGVHQRVRSLLERGHTVLLIHPEIDDQFPEQVRSPRMPGLKELRVYPRFSAWAFPARPVPFFKGAPEPLNHRIWSDTAVLARFKPDIVVVEEAAQLRGVCSLLLGGYGRPVGIEYGREAGVPVISLFHTDWVSYAASYLGSWFVPKMRPCLTAFVRQFVNAYTMTYFYSPQMLNKYRQLFGIHKVALLAFQGIDCNRFHPDNIRFDPIPGDGRPLVLFVGRLAREKNVARLLDVFEKVLHVVPRAHLAIVGSGPEADNLRRRAAHLGDSVTFWGEAWGDVLLGWYARADLFLNCSVTEVGPMTNLEALASGTPVVVAAAGGSLDQIINGHNGYLIPPDDIDNFAAQVTALLTDPVKRRVLGQQARALVALLDWNSCMQRFEDTLYSHVRSSASGVVGRE